MDGNDHIRPPEEKGNQASVNRERPVVSIEQFLASLRPEESVEGWTIAELCEDAGLPKTSRNKARVYRYVTDLIELGEWEGCGEKEIMSRANKHMWVPAYKPIDDKSTVDSIQKVYDRATHLNGGDESGESGEAEAPMPG